MEENRIDGKVNTENRVSYSLYNYILQDSLCIVKRNVPSFKNINLQTGVLRILPGHQSDGSSEIRKTRLPEGSLAAVL
jgi:hypothetical protein